MRLVSEQRDRFGVAPTCAALDLARASYYRGQRPARIATTRPTPVRALVPSERDAVLSVLHEPRFVDLSPAEIYATLLDEGRYLCSERTLYRVLASAQGVRERRDQCRHPRYAAPELLATGPNQLWSWDIERHEALFGSSSSSGSMATGKSPPYRTRRASAVPNAPSGQWSPCGTTDGFAGWSSNPGISLSNCSRSA